MIRNYKITAVALVLLCGIIVGLVIASRLDISPLTKADEPLPEKVVSHEAEHRNAFVEVAEKVGPAVVSISTERKEKIAERRLFMGPWGEESPWSEDEFFNKFFREFFGEIPEREYTQRGLGSGVIVDEKGYVLTNEHVVAGADRITVTLPDGRKFDGKVKGTDPRSDIAIIQIKADNLPAAELGDSDSVRTGQWVVAIGNPFGQAVRSAEPTVTVGVVSALHRSLPMISGRGREYFDLIQTDAAINPGNSGGPLCNLEGKIIGINVAIYSTTGGYMGIGFAIPINMARDIIGDLIEGKKVLYGWLGVTVQEMTPELAGYFNLSKSEGVLVAGIAEGGPADKGGMEAGDIILSLNNEKIESLRKLLQRVGRAKVGTAVPIEVLRGKKKIALTIKIGQRPTEPEAVMSKAVEDESKWRGLTVQEISPQLIEKFNLREKEGICVVEIDRDSPFYFAGIRPGDVIKEINRQLVNNLEDFKKATKTQEDSILIRTDKGYAVVKTTQPSE